MGAVIDAKTGKIYWWGLAFAVGMKWVTISGR